MIGLWTALLPVALAGAEPTPRALVIYLPNGQPEGSWRPEATGALSTLPPALAPLADRTEHLLVVSGLTTVPLPEGPEAHAIAASAALTGRDLSEGPPAQGDDDLRGIDRVFAASWGEDTPLRGLDLSSEGTPWCGTLDCAARAFVAYGPVGLPLAPLTHPRAAAALLFPEHDLDGSSSLPTDRAVSQVVQADAATVASQLGTSDQERFAPFADAVQALSSAFEPTPSDCAATLAEVLPPERLAGPFPLEQHAPLQLDLLALGLRCDRIRSGTWMLGNEGSPRPLAHLGHTLGHHALAHHGGDPDRLAALEAISRWELSLVDDLAERLEGWPTDAGTLLDETLLIVLTGMGDGDRHATTGLTALVLGGGAVTTGLPYGTHVDAGGASLVQLHKALAQATGLSTGGYGPSGQPALSW